MSFIPAIRDYIDLLNNVYDLNSSSISWQELISHTFIYIFNSIKFIFLYLITFQWIRDFSYLPVVIPQVSINIFKENYFIETPLFNFFNFLETPLYSSNKFLVGFLNSFFLSLPITCSHILCLRRFLIQGLFAGIFSALGTILGQLCFLVFVLFGFRFFLIPWFSFEPLSYILGILIILYVVYNMAHERRIRPITNKEINTLFNILLINFVLAWTEQSCIFQYLGNITFDAQPTILEIFSSTNEFEFFILHLTYLFGIFFGSLFFTICFGFFFFKLNNFVISSINFSYYKWIKYLNLSFLILLIGFSFTSIPYYGIDYLFTNPLGFTSRDALFDNTVFAQRNLKDIPRLIGFNSGFNSFDTDVVPFNRAKYLQGDPPQSFEELNFAGEYAWTSRTDRRPMYQQQKAKELVSKLLKQAKITIKKRDSVEKARQIAKGELEDKTALNKLPQKQKKLNFGTDLSSIQAFNLQDRFHSDYELGDPRIGEVVTIVQNDSFSREFMKEDRKTRFEKKIRHNYYSNSIFKFLINNEIDLFMKRQPQSYKLSGKKEKELYQKRLILANYYDSLRIYNQLPYAKNFQNIFCGSKSYADRVFNHQFKGTLKIVRRLFSITLNSEGNVPQKIILKFDQPLYKNKKHNFSIHEELQANNSPSETTPFLELTNPIPFYVGWDEQLRKLVITNRLLPRYLTGFEMKLPNKFENNEYWYLNNLMNSSKKIEFTAWPIPKKILQLPKSQSAIPYTVLFESIDDPKNQPLKSFFKYDPGGEWNYETLPSNVQKINNTGNVLPPTRGGFIWPGESKLKFEFNELGEK